MKHAQAIRAASLLAVSPDRYPLLCALLDFAAQYHLDESVSQATHTYRWKRLVADAQEWIGLGGLDQELWSAGQERIQVSNGAIIRWNPQEGVWECSAHRSFAAEYRLAARRVVADALAARLYPGRRVSGEVLLSRGRRPKKQLLRTDAPGYDRAEYMRRYQLERYHRLKAISTDPP